VLFPKLLFLPNDGWIRSKARTARPGLPGLENRETWGTRCKLSAEILRRQVLRFANDLRFLRMTAGIYGVTLSGDDVSTSLGG
jgi:hypothetical protein